MLLGWEWGWCLKYYVKLFGGVGVGVGFGVFKVLCEIFWGMGWVGGGGSEIKRPAG